MAVNRLLIDANNVLHALLEIHIDAGRSRLAVMIGEYVQLTNSQACIVFDGPSPRGTEASRIAGDFDAVIYSGHRSADDVIIQILNDYSAPRTVTLISSDRQLVKAGKRRKCKVTDSASFARELVDTLEKSQFEEPPKPEPPEKTEGLSEGQLDDWLDEFGIN